MPLSPSVIQTLDDLLEKNDHVVGYSEDELPELRDDQATDRTGIRVYVDELADDLGLPDQIEGKPVFPVAAGRQELKHAEQDVMVGVDPKTNVRPIIGGISLSNLNRGGLTGTLGYFVNRGGNRCVMTSGHILTTGYDEVIQRGLADGGTNADRVATLEISVRDPNLGVDAAAARIDNGINSTLTINDIGPINGTSLTSVGATVRKSGRTTGLTSGRVIDLRGVFNVGGQSYRNQIVVAAGATPFSLAGDSGSLIVAADDTGVGLLMGGSDIQDFCNPIAAVLSALGATLA
jgi:hypothetical protein